MTTRKHGPPIGRSEKWHTVPAGPGVFAYEHRRSCGLGGILRATQCSGTVSHGPDERGSTNQEEPTNA